MGLKQTYRASSGSFFNMLMANNESVPVAGEWATLLLYTDRKVVKVDSVSADGKTVVLESCDTQAARQDLPTGHQEWTHTPNGQKFTIRYLRGGWKRVRNTIEFEQSFLDRIGGYHAWKYLHDNEPEMLKELYGEHIMPVKVVPGYTRERRSYSPINILFGAASYYYDWSF
jgi:hypothetical protein